MCADAVMVCLYIQPEGVSQWVPPTAQACLQPQRVLEVCTPPSRTTASCCLARTPVQDWRQLPRLSFCKRDVLQEQTLY